jgi:hypothetical protein
MESPLTSVTDILRRAIDGVVDAGSDLGELAKDVSIGVLCGARRRGEAPLKDLSHAARAIMCHTAAIEGDTARAARGIVRGSIQSAKEYGLDAAETASAAARSVLDVTEDLGAAAIREVRQSVIGTIDGIEVFLSRPFSKRGKT